MIKTHYLTALVKNCSGVLTRISGLFARRGYNIESLTVCKTEDDALSRMTIVVSGDIKIIDQIMKQLVKQVEVISVEELEEDFSVIRELLLVRIEVTSDRRSEALNICNIFKASIVDVSPDSLMLQLTGKPQKIDAFITVVESAFKVTKLARSGASALKRGMQNED